MGGVGGEESKGKLGIILSILDGELALPDTQKVRIE